METHTSTHTHTHTPKNTHVHTSYTQSRSVFSATCEKGGGEIADYPQQGEEHLSSRPPLRCVAVCTCVSMCASIWPLSFYVSTWLINRFNHSVSESNELITLVPNEWYRFLKNLARIYQDFRRAHKDLVETARLNTSIGNESHKNPKCCLIDISIK